MPEETNISDLGRIAISLGVAVVIIVIITILVTTLRDTSLVPDQSNAIANGSNVTQTWQGNNTVIPAAERVSTGTFLLYNNGTIVNRGDGANANYSIAEAGVTIINASPEGGPAGQSEWVTGELNASYNYLYGSAARNATGYGLATQTTLSSFLPIVALTAAGAFVIMIVMRLFIKRRED